MSTEIFSLESPVPGVCKSHVLLRKSGENEWTPVLYFRKPKHVSQEDYERLMHRIRISIPKEADNV